MFLLFILSIIVDSNSSLSFNLFFSRYCFVTKYFIVNSSSYVILGSSIFLKLLIILEYYYSYRSTSFNDTIFVLYVLFILFFKLFNDLIVFFISLLIL